MYAEYAGTIEDEQLLDEQPNRFSDIQLPSVMNFLLFAVWIVIALVGLAVIFLAKRTVIGATIIAIPTFIGMVIKPTFALSIMMLVLPTGAGIGYREMFSLDRGVGIALAVSFLLNIIITRPRLRITNKALWIAVAYTLWVCLISLAAPYLSLELRRAFTQVQLLALVFIVYWILQTNSPIALRWPLRAYVIGTLGTIALAFITGAAIRTIEEGPEARYAATIGRAIDENMLAALIALALLTAIYLFARDKNLFWRILYLIAILVLPTMMLRIASRGALIALGFALLSPLLFIRQVLRRPALAAFLLVAVLVIFLSSDWLIKERGLREPVAKRLTDIGTAEEALSLRMQPIKKAVEIAIRKPTGASCYGWFEESGLRIWPHNDFFLALGLYGIPAAAFFGVFMIMMMFTIKRTLLGLEKLYARAVLTFLIIMGLNIGQLYIKYFWVFLAIVMASERVAKFFAEEKTESMPYVEYEEKTLQQHAYV